MEVTVVLVECRELAATRLFAISQTPTFSRLAAQAESELRDEPESEGSIARAKT